MREIKFRAWRKDTKKLYPPFTLWTYWNVKKFPADEEVEFKNVIFMQFTGLKDKNEKEIYEGDIVKCISFVAETQWVFTVDDIRYLDRMVSNERDREVIGNIYENKELLK